jgi:D-arginine dehydrogenase
MLAPAGAWRVERVSVRPDIVVIGAGIAGLSLAAELAGDAHVTVLEREAQPGYHSSGRSAALYIEPYLNGTVFALTRASRAFLEAPPAGYAAPLVRVRGGYEVAGETDAGAIDAFLARWSHLRPDLVEVPVAEALARVPVLRADRARRAAWDAHVLDIDVHALLDGHRRRLRAAGGELVTGAGVVAIDTNGAAARVTDAAGRSWTAEVVVVAAGAWSEQIVVAAGGQRIGLQPRRRTACLVDAPPGSAVAAWPVVHRAGGGLYFKPEAGRVLVSPADATPSPPCDAQPDEVDVAIAIDRLQAMASIDVHTVRHRWAGLRSFVADELPVVGFDARCPRLFWLAAQGGFGVQASPALARIGAALLLGRDTAAATVAPGVAPAELSPARPALATGIVRSLA